MTPLALAPRPSEKLSALERLEALTRGAQAAKLPAPWLEKVRSLAK